MLCTTKRQMFDVLVENANGCALCSRMDGRTRVLSKKNGNINSQILTISVHFQHIHSRKSLLW